MSEGTAHPVAPSAMARDPSWMIAPHFPLMRQAHAHDCGAVALSAVLSFWGRDGSPADISREMLGNESGELSAAELQAYARKRDLSSYVFYGTMGDIVYELRNRRPVIVGVGRPRGGNESVAHYEVVVGVDERSRRVLLLDPARGWQEDGYEGFATEWGRSRGVMIVVDGQPRTIKDTQLPSRLDGRYAARDEASSDAKKFRGGGVIVITATALLLVVLIILLIILI